MVEPPLSDYEVVRFLVKRGGRCTNYELVSNFRGILNNPTHQAEARLKFKDIINSVATVGEFQNVKYIELKPEYFPNNFARSQNEDSQASSGSVSLSSEDSGTSSYSSPFTQSFQPYWRYRLSTSPQIPPPRRPDLDASLRSPTSRSFSRSVSESTLPQERVVPPRTRSIRSASEEGQPQSINVHSRQPNHGRSSEHGDDFRRLSNHFSGHRPTNEFLPRQDVLRNSSAHFPSERLCNDSQMSNSLPYYSSDPYKPIIESETNQDFREGNVGLPYTTAVRGNSRLVENTLGESNQKFIPPKTRVSLSDLDKGLQKPSSQPPRNVSVNPPAHDRIRNSFDGSYLSRTENAELFCSKKNKNDRYSPPRVEQRGIGEQPLLDRKNLDCYSSPRTETSHLTKNSDSLRSLEMSWDPGDESNVFDDPNYIRTVSKLCLEKNKASPNNYKSNIVSPGQQCKDRGGDKLGNICQRDQSVIENVINQSSKISGGVVSLKERNIPLENIEDVAPIPPERRRRSQDNIQKVKESQDNIEPTGKMKTGQVKDRVQQFDQIEKRKEMTVDKENRDHPKIVCMEDDVSISVLDPKLKKEWFVKSSQCDYHALIALLKKEPKLAALKDVASGYTALHWAAKHGDANVVKLIAGAYKVNPNIRSNGGYTPLHLASLYKHDMIGHLLIHTYGADPSLRDYNGKKADQYPSNYVRMVAGHKNVERRPLKQRPLVAKEPSSNSFMRIGSLNLRKARKSTVFASVRGSSRNRVSSSDSQRLGASTRKKMYKRESLQLDKKCADVKKDAYGFPSKKQESS